MSGRLRRSARRLCIGDELVKEQANGSFKRHVVQGATPNGKVVLRRMEQDTLWTTWWKTEDDVGGAGRDRPNWTVIPVGTEDFQSIIVRTKG